MTCMWSPRMRGVGRPRSVHSTALVARSGFCQASDPGSWRCAVLTGWHCPQCQAQVAGAAAALCCRGAIAAPHIEKHDLKSSSAHRHPLGTFQFRTTSCTT